jgi:predicted DNA-binding transcriptional regulator YafY
VSRSARLLLLLQALQGRRHPVTAATLARSLAVSERTIYRDIAELAAQGAQIEGAAGLGYVLKPGMFLPPLTFSEDETEAILLGLRYVDQRGDEVLTKAAAGALAKLASVLSPQAQATLHAPLAIPGPPVTAFPHNTVPLAQLRAAIRAQRRLEIDYEDAGGARTQRTVWPLQLGFMDNARVLGAWCEQREAFRTFRTDRILAAQEGAAYPGRRIELLRAFRIHLSLSAPAPDAAAPAAAVPDPGATSGRGAPDKS